MNWSANLITTAEQIRELLANTRTIAILGIKTEAQAGQPAFYVPSYLQAAGFEIIPVPVYYPEVTQILGQKVYRSLKEIPGEVDLVNVFRRSQDVAAHWMIFLPQSQRRCGCNQESPMTQWRRSWQ